MFLIVVVVPHKCNQSALLVVLLETEYSKYINICPSEILLKCHLRPAELTRGPYKTAFI